MKHKRNQQMNQLRYYTSQPHMKYMHLHQLRNYIFLLRNLNKQCYRPRYIEQPHMKHMHLHQLRYYTSLPHRPCTSSCLPASTRPQDTR